MLKGLTFCKYPYNSNKQIVLALIDKLGHFNYHSHKKHKILDYVSDELKADKDVVLAAVEKDGISLEYASAQLKSDKDIVLAAVKTSEYALEYASAQLKADRDVIIAAVTHNPSAFKFVPNDFKEDKNNKDIILDAVTKYGNTLMYLPEIWTKDEEIMLAAINQNRLTIHYASTELKNKKEIVLAALKPPEGLKENEKEGVCNMIFDYNNRGFAKDYNIAQNLLTDPDILSSCPIKTPSLGGYIKTKINKTNKTNKTKKKKKKRTQNRKK